MIAGSYFLSIKVIYPNIVIQWLHLEILTPTSANGEGTTEWRKKKACVMAPIPFMTDDAKVHRCQFTTRIIPMNRKPGLTHCHSPFPLAHYAIERYLNPFPLRIVVCCCRENDVFSCITYFFRENKAHSPKTIAYHGIITLNLRVECSTLIAILSYFPSTCQKTMTFA